VEAAEEQGQVETQPSVDELAASAAKGLLESQEGVEFEKPRDEKGKFTKKADNQPAQQELPKGEEQEPEQQEEAEPEAEEEVEQPRKHKLTVKAEDGSDQEVEVDDEELKKGYMMERAFRMKTAQLARERESLQSKIKAEVEPKLKEYEEKLTMAEQAIWHTLAPEIQNTDWNKLAEENPAEWAKRYQHVQNVNSKLAQIQAEKKKVEEARQQETQSQLKKAAEESVERLKEDIPGWNNDLYGKILKAGVEMYGFKAEEVNAITDHRAIKALHDAMQYQALKAKPLVEKRQTPSAPKVVKPGAGEKPDANAEKWNQGMAKLQKSGGHTDDAVALAKLLLSREK
jgi:hypothetical protein